MLSILIYSSVSPPFSCCANYYFLISYLPTLTTSFSSASFTILASFFTIAMIVFLNNQANSKNIPNTVYLTMSLTIFTTSFLFVNFDTSGTKQKYLHTLYTPRLCRNFWKKNEVIRVSSKSLTNGEHYKFVY